MQYKFIKKDVRLICDRMIKNIYEDREQEKVDEAKRLQTYLGTKHSWFKILLGDFPKQQILTFEEIYDNIDKYGRMCDDWYSSGLVMWKLLYEKELNKCRNIILLCNISDGDIIMLDRCDSLFIQEWKEAWKI